LRIIIAGGRDFDNYVLLKSSVNKIIESLMTSSERIEIVSGRAKGADRLGEQYANEVGYPIAYFSADWGNLGKRAGYVRNRGMAKYAMSDGNIGMLIAFWDGKSKGTKHMIDLANRYGLVAHVVNF